MFPGDDDEVVSEDPRPEPPPNEIVKEDTRPSVDKEHEQLNEG